MHHPRLMHHCHLFGMWVPSRRHFIALVFVFGGGMVLHSYYSTHSPAWWRTNVQIWAWCCHLQIKRRPKKSFTNPSTLVPYGPWWLTTSPSPKLPITWFALRIVPNIVIESVTIVVSCYSSRDNTLRAFHWRLHYVFWMKNNQVYSNLG
jgi:hypothetical protein